MSNSLKNDMFTLLYKQIRSMSIISYSVSRFLPDYSVCVHKSVPIRRAGRADVHVVHKSDPFYSEYGNPAH